MLAECRFANEIWTGPSRLAHGIRPQSTTIFSSVSLPRCRHRCRRRRRPVWSISTPREHSQRLPALKRLILMAGPGRSMLYSFLLFAIILSLMEMYRGKLASSELLTIVGGFISSLIFLVLLTFIGNFQESTGTKTGWGAVALAESIALIAASTVHRVCITTCFLFSAALLYEVNKLSGIILGKSEAKTRRH